MNPNPLLGHLTLNGFSLPPLPHFAGRTASSRDATGFSASTKSGWQRLELAAFGQGQIQIVPVKIIFKK